LSLGIIVILIFLIVFHFKQRIESLEKKGFLLTELYNNLVKEFSIMKTVVYSPPAIQQKQNIVFSTEPSPPSYNKIIVMDKLSEVDEESDYDSESESESELDSESIHDLEVVELEPEQDQSIKVLKIDSEPEPESEPSSNLEVLKVESEPEQSFVLEESIKEEPELSSTTNQILYTDMKINELRSIVITKGLSSNPNKLKRAELLQLLEEETV